MNWAILPICVLAGLGVSLSLIPLIIASWRNVSHKNSSSFHHTHKVPVPRLGGIVFAATFLLTALVSFLWFPVSGDRLQIRLVVVIGSLAMFTLGFIDDLRPLGAKKKLIGQIIVALGVCYAGLMIETFKNPFTGTTHPLGLWEWPVTVLWLLAMTNMINLIDGIDGLAGGISLMLMALLTYVGLNGTYSFPILVAAGMCGALIGFLRYNFPPAKIYMGDGGAYFLGFLIGILTLVNSEKGTVVAALIAPLFALALPILDTSLAIVRRGLKGVPIFRADRSHIHHKLIQLGYSRTRTVLVLYAMSSVFLLLAFGAFWSQGRWLPMLFGFVCLIVLLAARLFGFGANWFSVGAARDSFELRRESQYALAVARWLELESERAKGVEELWFNFAFMAEKMRFTRVTLELEDGRREWKSPRFDSAERACHTHEFAGDNRMRVELCGDAGQMSSKLFEHICELMSEAWFKAAIRWQSLNRLPVRFDAKIEATTASPSGIQKKSPEFASIKPGVAKTA